jgi:uracil-DNA glycosylase
MSDTAEARREALIDVYRQVADCTRCPLHESRSRAVFGAGDADA